MDSTASWPSGERSRTRRARGEAGLYVIVDADACERRGLSVEEVLTHVLESSERPEVVQLRAKGRNEALLENWLDLALPLAREREVEFVLNDRPDLAALFGAGTVHVGQGDSPLPAVRIAFPELRVGLSTHDLPQLDAALGAPGLAYVALGPIYATASKSRPESVVGSGLLVLAAERARSRGVPLVAIGGIDAERIAEVAPHVDLVAVIAAALPDEGFGEGGDIAAEITRRLGALHHALRQHPARAIP